MNKRPGEEEIVIDTCTQEVQQLVGRGSSTYRALRLVMEAHCVGRGPLRALSFSHLRVSLDRWIGQEG